MYVKQPVIQDLSLGKGEYFDIILIGQTGQGKTTTADKLLIANRGGRPSTTDTEIIVDPEKLQVHAGDLTLWRKSPTDFEKEAEIRLQNLAQARADQNPDLKIKQINEALTSSGSLKTKHCTVFSNEISKVRVFDLPGFFDEEGVTGGPGTTLESDQNDATAYNLSIMRKILQIQVLIAMKFKRILYFLPVRGPLERATAVLQLELRVLTSYFGPQILSKIVLVATNSPMRHELDISEEIAFPEMERSITKQNFRRCLSRLFPEERFPDIPLIYVSLSDSCELVLDKVIQARVDPRDLDLKLNQETCENCGRRIRTVLGERVMLHIDDDNMIPYDESTCHPVFETSWERHMVNFLHSFFTEDSSPSRATSTVVCSNCHTDPGTLGCMQVGQNYVYRSRFRRQTTKVDHKYSVQA